jgi:hypothetical protein
MSIEQRELLSLQFMYVEKNIPYIGQIPAELIKEGGRTVRYS